MLFLYSLFAPLTGAVEIGGLPSASVAELLVSLIQQGLGLQVR